MPEDGRVLDYRLEFMLERIGVDCGDRELMLTEVVHVELGGIEKPRREFWESS